jgi:chorismate mutase
MTVRMPDTSLEDIRREIDAIDDALLDLVIRRFAATGKVRARKQSDGSIAASPLRPAREATMLRRLIARADGQISPELLVRLWRVILSTSTQSQAPIVIHADRQLVSDTGLNLSLAEHFCGMPITAHDTTEQVFKAVSASRGDLAAVTTTAPWADYLASAAGNGVRLIGALPVIGSAKIPELLVFGHADAQPSGEDDTIVISRGPVIAGARWHAASGSWTVSCVPGFLSDEEVRAVMPLGAEFIVAGRYPRSIEVTS